ncbi:MAG: methyltransferase domain-containing protein [Acidobacteria bacterium]|nr:methyltransferase domain-containing protein [Acidobacteriota bacterium]
MKTAPPCPVCGSERTRSFLRRTSVPVHQNLVCPTRQDALQVARGDLSMRACHTCGFVFNAAFEESRLSYGVSYDNTQSHSAFFRQHLLERATHLVGSRDVTGCRIVEVGCGKGEFLRLLVEDPAHGNTGVGFDPSHDGPLSDCGGRMRFEHRFFDETCTGQADVVICRHVIEHVPRPVGLLSAVRRAVGGGGPTRVFLETPCVEWILRHRVFWDFFYEHCSLFSAGSLKIAFERSGFSVRSVGHVFGGQYLWIEATPAGSPEETPPDARDIPRLTRGFAVAESCLRAAWSSRIGQYADAGKVALWGAGAKGCTFACLVDPENRLIDCLVDLNRNKQGRFVPGTGHPILGEERLPDRGVRTAILMNPNYREENTAMLERIDRTIRLVE